MSVATGKMPGISKKDADAVWEWAEANQDMDPVAEAYIGACSAIGVLDRKAVASKLGITEFRMSQIDAYAFRYRDELARGIAKMLRRVPDGC